MKKLKIKINFKDNRGIISDILENENINAITLITIKKGKVRGNHYHKKTYQWNYIINGKMKLVTKRNGYKKTIILNKDDVAVTTPYEQHALVGVTNCKLLVFTKGPRGGKEYESDTYRLKIPLHK
jgi:quercetin dioxygenase-like cupin family protein